MDALVFDVEKEQNQNRQQLLGEDEPSFSSGAPETASHMRNLGTSTHNLVMQQAELLSSLNLADFPGKETDQEWQYIDPPDSGYSWLVLFCCIILHLASGTLSATAGLFLVEFNDAFKGNESGYSWICTLQQTMGFLAGPLIGKLADKIGARTTIIMGCIGVAISLVFASLTSNFVVLLLTYGILAGISTCCILIPTSVCAGDYFVKYRIFALTASTCCWPLMYLIVTPVTSAAIQRYGWRVTIIGIACIFVQVTVLAALLRPRRLSKQCRLPEQVEQKSEATENSKLGKDSYTEFRHVESHYSLYAEDCVLPSTASYFYETSKQLTSIDQPLNDLLIYQPSMKPTLSFVSSLEPALEEGGVMASSNILQSNNQKNSGEESLQVLLSPQISETSANNREIYFSVSKVKEICFAIRNSPLIHWRMLILVSHNLFWSYSASTFYILLPELCKSLSIDSTKVSQLFMIIGIAGFVGRLFAIILCRVADNFGKGFGTLVTMLIQSGAMFGLAFTSSFECFAVMVGIYSFAYGVSACFVTPVILELHGNNNLATVFGIEMCFFGAGAFISTPFSTYLFQKFGTYSIGYQVAAGASILGGLVYLPHVIKRKTDKE